jgi:tRNA dimethylallyltransferase
LRAALEQEAALHGSAALHRRLAGIDPAAAAAIAPENVRRIIRALEVFEVSGQPISAQQGRRPPPYHIKTRWLIRERSELYARIDQRVDAMMAAGLIAEVAGLIEQGYTWELPAMSSLGYIQFRPYLAGEADLADCVQQLKYDTHAFARRQESWFRRLPGLQHYPMAD